MKTISVVIYSVWFIAFAMLMSNLYLKLHIAYSVWLTLTIILTVVMVILFLIANLTNRKNVTH